MQVNSRQYGDLSQWIKNPICKVVWAGWETDTLALQKAGWQLAMEQDPMRDALQLIMKHEPCRLYAISHSINYNFMRNIKELSFSGDVVFTIKWMASRFEVVYSADMGNFRAVNAQPMLMDVTRRNIEDFNLFTPLVETKEILIEPKDVKECLDRILKFQSPKQQEIRERKRSVMRRMGGTTWDQVEPAFNVNAQILSIVNG